jgi:electron transfer flavoprotein alpha subunit
MSAAREDVWVYVEHLQGVVAGHTYELLGKGRELADALGGRLVAVLIGNAVQPLGQTLGAADRVMCVEGAGLADFTPEAHAGALQALAGPQPPRVMLFGATSIGMDLAALLSAGLGIPLIVNCKDATVNGQRIVATSQLCGGKFLCEAEDDGVRVILTVLPGALPAERGLSDRSPAIEPTTLPSTPEGPRMRVTRMIEPAAGDVDITKVPVLVAIGRGIQRKENLPLAEDLACRLGGVVCASRPVVDQGWMPLSRQVGKSGMIVKPRLYLALGISGAPEHVQGMKDAELIIAVNTDAGAPIFEVADYGAALDLFELLPALIQALDQRKGLAAAS